MPLRLDSITNNSQDSSLIAWILQSGTQECDSAFATPDKKYIHMKRKIVDRSSGDKIGELIFTLQNTGKQLEVLDIDIILANETASRIRFETLKEQSDSNEYYEVSTTDQDAHLIIETVNRFTEPNKLITKLSSEQRKVLERVFDLITQEYDRESAEKFVNTISAKF